MAKDLQIRQHLHDIIESISLKSNIKNETRTHNIDTMIVKITKASSDTSEKNHELITEIKARSFQNFGIKASSRISDLYLQLMTIHNYSHKMNILKFLASLADYMNQSSPPSVATSLVDSIADQKNRLSVLTFHNNDILPETKVCNEDTPKNTENFQADCNNEVISDVPYILSGINCDTIFFDNLYAELKRPISYCLVQDLGVCIEAGLIYRAVNRYTEVASSKKGLLYQSMITFINGQLSAYMSVVSAIDKEFRHHTLDPSPKNSTIQIKKCLFWINESLLALRLLLIVLKECEEYQGGNLLQKIYQLGSNGDPFVHNIMSKLLSSIAQPFFEITTRWIYDGELHDPYNEFIIKPSRLSRDEMACFYKYELQRSKIPNFLPIEIAQRITLIGNNLNYIRHACKEDYWVMNYSIENKKEFTLDNIEEFFQDINKCYDITVTKVKEFIFEKFHLVDHLNALKKYILLGQGDFVALLLENIGPTLKQPANKLFRYNLTSFLEYSIRASNAQFEPEHVIRRLDARLLELSHGEIGWDVFTLEYKLESPLDAIVGQVGNRQYLKIFNFLWRIKRVESSLNSTWQKIIIINKNRLWTKHQYLKGDLLLAWTLARSILHEMIHFIAQLQYYILFEVIESSWGQFMNALGKEDCTLDIMVDAHVKFVNDITHKGLLGSVTEQTSMLSRLHDILKGILIFVAVTDILIEQIALTIASGSMKHQSHQKLTTRLQNVSILFKKQLSGLLYDLAFQPDLAMRFLGIRLNMNEYYDILGGKNESKYSSKDIEN